MIIKRAKGLSGEVSIPGDKSISHRSIMLGSLAKGDTEVYGFLQGADCLSSIRCFSQMGIEIENDGNKVVTQPKQTLVGGITPNNSAQYEAYLTNPYAVAMGGNPFNQ